MSRYDSDDESEDSDFDDEADVVEDVIQACENGDFAFVRKQISSGHCSATCTSRNYPKPQPIHNACLEGHLDIVTFLVDECDVSPTVPDMEGWTPFLCACDGGHLEVVKYLVERGADVQDLDSGGESGVHHASSNGALDVVSWLVDDMKVSPSLANEEGLTPAQVGEEHEEIVEYFAHRQTLAAEREQMSLTEFADLQKLKLTAENINEVQAEWDAKEAEYQQRITSAQSLQEEALASLRQSLQASHEKALAELRAELEEQAAGQVAEADRLARAELEEELSERDTALADSQTKIETLESEVRKLHLAHVESNQSSEEEAARSEEEFQRMFSEALEAKEELFFSEKKSLEESFSRKIKIQDSEIQRLESENSQLQRNLRKKETELEEVKSELESELEETNTQLETQKIEEETLQNQILALQNDIERLSAEDLVGKLKRRLKRKEREVRKARREGVIYAKAASQLKVVQAERDAFREELDQLRDGQ